MDPWLAATFASGVLLALFGVLLLTADPRRDWNRVFALFAVFWGLQIVLANGVRVAESLPFAHILATMSIALLIPLYFFLVVFASVFPRPRAPFATGWPALLALLLPAAFALVLLLAAPRLLLQEVAAHPDGGSTMRWGPLFPVLVLAPLYSAFYYALFVMMRRLDEAPRPIERRQIVLVLIALTIFVAYNVPLQLILFGSATLGAAVRSEAADGTAALIGSVMLVGLLLLFALTARIVRDLRRPASRAHAQEGILLLVAILAPATIGAIEGIVDLTAAVRLQAVGLVRVAAVGLIVYGIARYQLFDLDLRVKNAVPIASTLIVAAATGAAIWSLVGSSGLGTPPAMLLVGFVSVALAAALGLVVRRLLDRLVPHVQRKGQHLDLRRLEVYCAALEAAHVAGQRVEPNAELAARLGLSENDERLAHILAAQRMNLAAALVPGALAFGRYFVEACIGHGTYGRVFLAKDTRRGEHVVIKELEARWRGQPQVLARFLREARIMGRIRHPNVAALHDVERRGDDHYLVVEHVEGGDLAARLRAGRLPYPEAIAVAADVAEALAAAHARGVVHRDVKPANILLDLDGRAKLIDFGVAALHTTERDKTFEGLPPPNNDEFVGNLQYMAPEQAAGAPVGPQSDLYALGAVLYHMVAGSPHRVFSGLDVESARLVAMKGPPPSLGGVPHPLHRILGSLLAPNPDERPSEAAAVAKELCRLLPVNRPPLMAYEGTDPTAHAGGHAIP